MATAKPTTNHDEIRKWVEARGGHPARVKATGRGKDPGILRIDFPGFSGEGTLEEIEWDEFFDWFDRNNLAMLLSNERGNRFNKLVARGAGSSGKKSSAKSAAKSSARKSAGKSSSRRVVESSSKKAAGAGAGAKSGGAKKASSAKSSAKKSSAKKSSATKASASTKKAAASSKKAATSSKKSSAKKSSAKKSPAKKSPAKKSPAKQSSAKKSSSKKTTTSKTRRLVGSTTRSGGSKTTTNHDEIRRWVEARGGFPATVAGTESRGEEAGLLRIDYPGYSGHGTLERIDWDAWFEKFDEENLAFLYQDKKNSRFSKLVRR